MQLTNKVVPAHIVNTPVNVLLKQQSIWPATYVTDLYNNDSKLTIATLAYKYAQCLTKHKTNLPYYCNIQN